MAFLMLLHEKMRLQRKINKLTAKQLLASSRKERVAKQIERIQKMYSKKEKQIENAVKTGSSMFKANILQQFGLGTQGMGPMSYCGGTSIFSQQEMTNMANQIGVPVEAVQAVYMGQVEREKDAEGNYTDNFTVAGQNLDKDQINKIQAGLQFIRQQESMRSYGAQMMQTQYDQNISIWEQAAQAQLEAEQDAVLAPLSEQENDWDMESQTCETLLADYRARLEGINQAISQEQKEHAPKFGLG